MLFAGAVFGLAVAAASAIAAVYVWGLVEWILMMVLNQ